MRILIAAAAFAAAMPALAQAQDASQNASGAVATSASAPSEGAAPVQTVDVSSDTRSFRIEPYVAVSGGYEWFDREPNKAGIPGTGQRMDGEIVKGAVGVNVPFHMFFVGAEANVAKGWRDIDWEYGIAGRVGIRPGNGNGLLYVKGGYQWVTFQRHVPDTGHAYKDWTMGAGFEIGPKMLGMGNMGGVRFRGEVNTFGNFHSLQPTAGLVLAF